MPIGTRASTGGACSPPPARVAAEPGTRLARSSTSGTTCRTAPWGTPRRSTSSGLHRRRPRDGRTGFEAGRFPAMTSSRASGRARRPAHEGRRAQRAARRAGGAGDPACPAPEPAGHRRPPAVIWSVGRRDRERSSDEHEGFNTALVRARVAQPLSVELVALRLVGAGGGQRRPISCCRPTPTAPVRRSVAPSRTAPARRQRKSQWPHIFRAADSALTALALVTRCGGSVPVGWR